MREEFHVVGSNHLCCPYCQSPPPKFMRTVFRLLLHKMKWYVITCNECGHIFCARLTDGYRGEHYGRYEYGEIKLESDVHHDGCFAKTK